MKSGADNFTLQPSAFGLVARLWLHEPDDVAIARAVSELGLPNAHPTKLASAYADVFLLNVPPYGTVFTDPEGELNGSGAQRMAALYEAHHYQPPELREVGAPDHVGLCLGLLGELGGLGIEELSLDWIAVCCFAVEREPTALPFYHRLAAVTREALLAHPALSAAESTIPPFPNFSPEEEVSIRSLLHFFLTPARSGIFLSRSRLGQIARTLGLRLPFGSRFDVAEILFASAGEGQQLPALLDSLEREIEEWRAAYHRWAEVCPGWRPASVGWLARTAGALRTLDAMRATAAALPQ